MAQQQKETIEQTEKIEQTTELADEQLEKASGGTAPISRPKKSGDPEDGGN